MNTYCPLIKEICKGNECVMWRDENCLINAFAENMIQQTKEGFDETIPIGVEPEDIDKEISEEIKLSTSEELAAELISFAKKEFPDEERIWVHNVAQLFWGSKNIEKWNIPVDIRFKIEKAEMLAQKQLNSEREVKKKEQLEEEKTELTSLVNLCVDWARGHGLKRVTQADVDAFLLEKNIDVLSQTKRSLYAMANVAIKSRY